MSTPARRLLLFDNLLDSDARAFINAALLSSPTQKTAINNLVKDLKNAGLWSKFYAIYPIVGGTAAAHSFNLKNSALYPIVWSNSPTHSANGVDFNGTQFGRTGLVPSAVLTANNTALHYYSREDTAAASISEIGARNNAATAFLAVFLKAALAPDGIISQQYDNNTAQGRLNAANSNSSGMFTFSRTASNAHAAYRNGTSLGSQTTSGGSLPAFELYIGARNNEGVAELFTNRQCAFAAVSSGLTAAEAQTMYQIVQSFQTYLGRAV